MTYVKLFILLAVLFCLLVGFPSRVDSTLPVIQEPAERQEVQPADRPVIYVDAKSVGQEASNLASGPIWR